MPSSSSASPPAGAPPPTAQAPRPNCLTKRVVRVTSGFHVYLSRAFAALAAFVWRRSCLVILASLVLALGGTVGLLWRNEESSGEKIWVPQDSRSVVRQDLLDDVWALDVTGIQIIFEPRDEPGSAAVLTSEILGEAFALHDRIQALTAPVPGEDEDVSNAELCLRDSTAAPLPSGEAPCALRSPMQWWGVNETLATSDPDPEATVRAIGDLQTSPVSKVPFEAVFAENEDGTRVVAMMTTYLYNNNDVDRRMALEQGFLDMMVDIVAASDKALGDGDDVAAAFAGDDDAILRYSRVSYVAQRTIDDELQRSVGNDIGLFGLAIVLMFAYSAFALSRWSWLDTKFMVALMGTLSVLLAIGMSFGICSATQLYFTSLTGILPFLLVGIGVDDMFVMVDAIYYRRGWPSQRQLALLSKEDRDQLLRQRFKDGIVEAGSAITITSVTNACAFYLGAFTSIPAVQAFCIFAGTGVLCDFLLQVTFFGAYVAIDLRRRAAGRVEVAPCVTRGVRRERDVSEQSSHDDDDEDDADAVRFAAEGGAPEKDSDGVEQPKASLVRRALGAYGRVLTRKPVAAAVVLLFLAATGGAVYLATNLQQGLPLTDLVPNDSYYITFSNQLDDYFGGFGGTYYIGMGDTGLDYASLESQVAWEELTREVEDDESTFKDSELTTSWQRSLAAYVAQVAPGDIFCPPDAATSVDCTDVCPSGAGGCVEPTRYYQHLTDFLNQPFARPFRDSFVALRDPSPDDDDGTTPISVTGAADIRATRIAVPNAGVGDEVSRAAALVRFHAITDDWQDRLEGVFVHTRFFIFVESDLVQLQETVLTLSLALVAVLAVSSLMLVHPILSPIVAFCILMIDGWLFGYMSLVGIRFNALSVTNLVMSVGLSADFVCHVAHGFVCGAPHSYSRAEKVNAALTSLGVPVLHGGATTFLGVLLLSFASSTVFNIFFQMMIGIVVISLLFALVFLPALLRFVGPTVPLHGEQQHDNERHDNVKMGVIVHDDGEDDGGNSSSTNSSSSADSYYSSSSSE